MRWIPTKIALWASGLAFAGLAHASDTNVVLSVAPVTGHWPWIAAVAIAGLLGVVSFASRRRIHAVVGS